MENRKADPPARPRAPERISAKDYRALTAAGKPVAVGSRASKFGAKRIETDAGSFDSKGEYQRYLTLKTLERCGQISNLNRQERIALIVNDVELTIADKNGRRRKLAYWADFTYTENGVKVIEDFKGFDTPVSRLKRAIVEAMLTITVRVTRR